MKFDIYPDWLLTISLGYVLGVVLMRVVDFLIGAVRKGKA